MLKRAKSAELAGLLFILALALLFLWRVTLGGKVLLPLDNLFSSPPWKPYASQFGAVIPHNELISDMVLQNLPWKEFARESYQRGKFPLWNPYIFSGVPFLAAGQCAVLYPLGVLFYLLSVVPAYGWFAPLHLFLGGAFMYFYMRVIGVGKLGGLVSGITFAFCSFLIVSLVWPMVVSTVIWLPLVLACIELIIRNFEPGREHGVRGSLPWVLVGGVTIGLQFLAGHVEFSFYILFSAAFYAAGRLFSLLWQGRDIRPPLRAGLALVVMIALGFGLAASQLIPFLELMKENYRSGLVTYSDVIGWALPKRQVLSFLIPDFFGNPTHHSYFDIIDWRLVSVTNATDFSGTPRSYPFWGVKNYIEGAAYVGILPLILAGVAFILRRNRYTWLFGIYAAFSLLLAFGTPLYRLFFYGIPGFDQLHTPFRWVFPYSASVAVLAGIGASALIEGGRDKRNAWWQANLLGKVALAGGGALLLVLALSRLFSGFSLRISEQVLRSSKVLPFAFENGQMLYSYQFRNLLLFALLVAASGLLVVALGKRGEVASPLLPTLLLALIVIDLFSFGYNFNSATDARLLDFTPPSVDFIKSDPAYSRIASFGYEDTLTPNTAMLFGIQDARGYDSIILKRYVEFWRLLEEPHGLFYNRIHKLVKPESLQSPLLNLLNIKYIVTAHEIRLPNLTEVYRGEVNIYRNEKVLPRAFAIFDDLRVDDSREALKALANPSFDPSKTVVLEGAAVLPPLPSSTRSMAQANIIDYQPEAVTIQVEMPAEGYLVLADSYFPGWRAQSGGGELPILRADYTFRAVRLPQGSHTVVFKYSPDSFKIGLFVTLVSGVLLLVGMGYWSWQRFYRETEETSTVRRIVKNSLTPMAAQVLNKVVDFAFTIFMLRLLGPLNAGKYAFAIVLIGYFAILTDFGLGTLLTREVAKDKAQGNRYLSNSVILRMGLCLASVPLLLAILGLYAWRFELTGDTTATVLLFAVSLVPSGIASALSAVFNAHEKMEYPAAVSIATTLIRVFLGVIALLLGWGIVGLAAVSVLASTATALILFTLVARTFFKPTLETDSTLQRDMMQTSTPLMINNLLSTIFFRIDVMLLKPMKGDAVTGWYTTAYKFLDGLNIIPAFFTLAIFPIMSRYAETARDSLVGAFTRSLKALLIVSLPITVGTTIIADKLIILCFGEEYAPSIIALQILIWFLPFSYVNSVTQYVLIAVNQQRFLTLAFLIGASFNFVANLLVIPYYGFQGAAFITIMSEIILMIPFFYAVRKYVGDVPLLKLALRPTIAAAVMGLSLIPLRDTNLLFMVLAGAIIYAVVLFLLRTFDEEDIALFKALRGQ